MHISNKLIQIEVSPKCIKISFTFLRVFCDMFTLKSVEDFHSFLGYVDHGTTTLEPVCEVISSSPQPQFYNLKSPAKSFIRTIPF